MNPIALVLVLIVLISVGVYFGTKKKDEDEDEASGGDDGEEVTLPKGRYVRLTYDDKTGKNNAYVLVLKEIKVLGKDGVTNLALNKPVGVSGHWSESRGPKAHAVDGDIGTFWHSQHDAIQDFIEIDLGAEKEIAKIEISGSDSENVYNGVKSIARIAAGGTEKPDDNGAYIIISDKDKKEVKKTPFIEEVAAGYSYDFSVKTPKWVSLTV